MRIGVISDTHGFLDSRVYHHFADVQHILHAGDVGDDIILDELAEIAPLSAVSGNVDYPLLSRRPQKWIGTLGGLLIGMTHGHLVTGRDFERSLTEFFLPETPRLIIHGHSHVARFDTHGDVTILNPGAACRPRFRDVPSICILEIAPDGTFFPKFIELAPR